MNMRLIFLSLIAGVFLTISIVGAGEKSCDELIADSEKLWMENKLSESDKRLDEAMKICPDRAELTWRKARTMFYRIENLPRDKKPEKAELIKSYRKIEALADRCIELDENNGSCMLWKGVGMGRRGTTQGVLKSLWMAEEVEKYFLMGISLKPSYRSEDGYNNHLGDSYYAMGMFYRVVPQWLCHFPLKQIIGTCGDKEKSVEFQRKALACEPNRISFTKELAVSLLCHGQKYNRSDEIEEGKKLLKKIQSLPVVRPMEEIDKKHTEMLLDDISLACGYQRDKQQELSKEAYDKNN